MKIKVITRRVITPAILNLLVPLQIFSRQTITYMFSRVLKTFQQLLVIIDKRQPWNISSKTLYPFMWYSFTSAF